MAGLGSTGFVPKTIEEVLADIEEQQLTNVDPALDLSPETPLGQINGIVAQKLAEVWELLAVAFNAFNPNVAEGFMLHALGALTGTTPLPASRSEVDITVTMDAGVTVPAQALVINVLGQPAVRFRNKAAIVSTSSGNYTARFEAEETGPVAANSGTLNVITAPVSGVTAVTNALDADLGRNAETDAEFRARREEQLTAEGSGTVDAIQADVLTVDGVLQCSLFENVTNETDSNGLPPHSFEVVVFDGVTPDADDDEIAQVIWDSKPSGIETYGMVAGSATDSAGTTRTVNFSRATTKPLYLTYTLTTDSTFPSDGADQVKAAAVAKGNSVLKLGQDVIALAFRAAALSVTGVVDVSDFRLGFTVSPVGTANLSVTDREIAVADTSRILVTV